MTIELKNEYLTVQFKTLGGQLTSIKDKDGLEYLWQADPDQSDKDFRQMPTSSDMGYPQNL